VGIPARLRRGGCQRIVLATDMPEYNLKNGDIGTVVLVHQEGVGYEVEVVAENLAGVSVVGFDGGAGEADKEGVGEGVAEVFGETVGDLGAVGGVSDFGFEAVLAAVGFVCHEDDVGAIAQLFVFGAAFVWGEFLDSGKDDAARSNF